MHHDDAVGLLHGGDALRDDNLRRVRDLVVERLADHLVGLRVDRARGIVEDQDLRLLEQRAGDAQTLALAARHIRAALLDVGVVLVGELLDETVRLCELARVPNLLVSGIRVAPAQILGDRA